MGCVRRIDVRLLVGCLTCWIAFGAGDAISNRAAAAEPVAVFSLRSIDELRSDFGYLTQAAGQGQAGAMVVSMLNGFLEGVDTSRPAGLWLFMEGFQGRGVGFIPVSDGDRFIEQMESQFGASEDVGDGIRLLSLGQDAYFVESNGWLFLADNPAQLLELPDDPTALLGELPEQYDVSLRLFPQHLPEELREVALGEVRRAMEQGFDGDSTDPAEQEMMERFSRSTMESITMFIEDTESVTLGWNVDRDRRSMWFDVAIVALADSRLAGELDRMQDQETMFAGFEAPGAAATMLVTSRLAQADIDQMQAMLQVMRREISSAIEDDPDLPTDQSRAAARSVAFTLLDVLEETVGEGVFDMGAAVMLEPRSLTFVAGARVANGEAVEEALRKLVELAGEDPEVPKIAFDADQHRDVALHTFEVPIPEDEGDARLVMGESLQVVVGTGEQSFYLAFGRDCVQKLKQVIDASAENPRTVPPARIHVSLQPIMEFLSTVDTEADLERVVAALQQANGQDQISLTVTGVPRGMQYRLEMGEGVIRAVAAQAGGR